MFTLRITTLFFPKCGENKRSFWHPIGYRLTAVNFDTVGFCFYLKDTHTMELNISNQLSSSAILSIKMPPCYRGLSPAHSPIKLSRSAPDDLNPPIHIPPHRKILRALPCAPEPPSFVTQGITHSRISIVNTQNTDINTSNINCSN